MKPFLFILLLSAITAAQSGRVKPAESPTPKPKGSTPIVYAPTNNDRDRVATPTPTPVIRNDDSEITVDSTLVPIPVTVFDTNGRAVTNLKLSDFDLKIDGKPAEIGEVTRSETPVRLAMLFDNSSSVMLSLIHI